MGNVLYSGIFNLSINTLCYNSKIIDSIIHNLTHICMHTQMHPRIHAYTHNCRNEMFKLNRTSEDGYGSMAELVYTLQSLVLSCKTEIYFC